MNTKLKIKLSDFLILKAYMQAQLLLETLDDIENESKMGIKHSTKIYKDSLEHKIQQVIKNTFKSNQQLFDKIILDMNKGLNSMKEYFEII